MCLCVIVYLCASEWVQINLNQIYKKYLEIGALKLTSFIKILINILHISLHKLANLFSTHLYKHTHLHKHIWKHTYIHTQLLLGPGLSFFYLALWLFYSSPPHFAQLPLPSSYLSLISPFPFSLPIVENNTPQYEGQHTAF